MDQAESAVTPGASTGVASLNQAAERLWLSLQDAWPSLSIEVLPVVDSTNAHALRLGREGASEPTVVVAWEQRAGRGRAGRSWDAEAGRSLTVSLAMPMALGAVPGGPSALSLVAGLVVAETLDGLLAVAAAPRVCLKWPNDVWVDDRKLGGLLIEVITGPSLPADHRWVVIGLGLNLHATTGPVVDATRCNVQQLGLALSPGQAMTALIPPLLTAIELFQRTGFAPFHGRYTARDALLNRTVALWRQPAAGATGSPTGPLDETRQPDALGVARGVDPVGALRIDDGQGNTVPWHVGEVSVRPGPHPL